MSTKPHWQLPVTAAQVFALNKARAKFVLEDGHALFTTKMARDQARKYLEGLKNG